MFLSGYNIRLKTMNLISSTLETMYATTESGQECNANLMSTQEECEAAIPQIQHLIPGAYFAGSLSMADRPTGCFYHPGGTSIYWNTNALGKSCSSCRSVCKQSKSALYFYFFLIYYFLPNSYKRLKDSSLVLSNR